MGNVAAELERYIATLAAEARVGDRLPPVRDLMKRFGLSQVVVQRVVHALRAQGLVEVHAGKGIFFIAGGDGTSAERVATTGQRDAAAAPASRARSVLVLRRAVHVDRGRPYIERLRQRLLEAGHKVIEVSFSDAAHAKTVLKALPRFDACVIQSVYHAVPSDMLATIQEKADAVLFDGITMVGDGVDSIGTEWGEPLTEAAALLRQRGHRRLCFAATSLPLLATRLGLRRWEYMGKRQPDTRHQTLLLPLMPDEGYAESLAAELQAMADAQGRLPFSALIVWGITDGARFRRLLDDAGIVVPGRLSVVLLGRTDLRNEHADFFEIFGTRVEDQVRMMIDALDRRWAEPAAPFGAALAPVTHREGLSVGSGATEPATLKVG